MDVPAGAVLNVVSGVPNAGAVPLDKARHLVGRAPSGDIDLDNPYVSREHAEITWAGGEYSIRDLESKNGTFVDGRRLGTEAVRLRGGETVEFGAKQVVTMFGLGSSTVTLPSRASPPGSGRPDQASPPKRGLHVDMRSRDVHADGELIASPLSKKEFDVLSLLWERQGEACSKYDIAARGWPERESAGVSDQEISQCVHRIRARVEPKPAEPRFIISIRGFGYRLAIEE